MVKCIAQVVPQFHKLNQLTRRFVIICCVFLVWDAYSGETTNVSDDPISFFKRAISSPPDVEKYIASQRSIPSGSANYFVGARAGSNYFMKFISDTDALRNLNKANIIVGQSGANAYQIGQDNVSYGIGSNPLTSNSELLLRKTRQFLDMGITEIDPESVRWEGNSFTATMRGRFARHGELSVSNGLPYRLFISVAKDSPPYKMVEYTYSNPPPPLSGFPSKMVISGNSDGKLIASEEIQIYSVQVAKRPLSDNFFTAAQFIATNIIATNIYSNTDLYVVNRRGQTVKLPDSVKETGGYSNSHPRSLIILCLVLTSIVPLVFFIVQHNRQTKATYDKTNRNH